MADIGTLAVKLVARTQDFVTGIRSASKSIVGFSSAGLGMATKAASMVTSAFTSIASGFAIITGAASLAVGAFTYWQKQIIDSTGALTDNADKIGTTATALAALEYAVSPAGVSVEDLSKGLQKMLRNLGEAAKGSKTAQAAFKQLGFDAKSFINLSADQQFLAIAGAINQIQKPAEKLRLTMAVFGKGGASLIPAFGMGGEEPSRLVAEAEKLGIAFDEIGIRNVDAAGDALGRLGKLIEGVGRQIAVQLAPYIEAVAIKLTDMAIAGEGIGPKMVDSFEMVVKSIVKASSYLESFLLATKAIKYGVLEIGESFAKLALKAYNFADNFGIIDVSKDILGATKDLENIQKEMGSTLFDMGKTIFTFPTQDEISKFFESIRAQARENAAAAGAAVKPIAEELVEASETFKNNLAGVGKFALNLSRQTVTPRSESGSFLSQTKGSPQIVRSPQFETMIDLLKRNNDLLIKNQAPRYA